MKAIGKLVGGLAKVKPGKGIARRAMRNVALSSGHIPAGIAIGGFSGGMSSMFSDNENATFIGGVAKGMAIGAGVGTAVAGVRGGRATMKAITSARQNFKPKNLLSIDKLESFGAKSEHAARYMGPRSVGDGARRSSRRSVMHDAGARSTSMSEAGAKYSIGIDAARIAGKI